MNNSSGGAPHGRPLSKPVDRLLERIVREFLVSGGDDTPEAIGDREQRVLDREERRAQLIGGLDDVNLVAPQSSAVAVSGLATAASASRLDQV